MQATKRVKDPRKQRKLLHNAPAHVRHKLMAAPLSKELTASKGAKTLPVRKGDTVRIMRGDHSGFEGKISRIDLKRYRIFIEGLTREKVDGTNIFVAVHPSKVMIRSLNLEDKWRKAIVDRKHELELPQKEEVKIAPKPGKKAAELKGEKPLEEAKVVPSAKKTPRKKKVTEKPMVAQEKPAAKKEEAQMPPEEKPAAKKRKEKTPAKKEKLASKKMKSESIAKKISPKRKAVASKKGGGT